jgi:hypothetical protein
MERATFVGRRYATLSHAGRFRGLKPTAINRMSLRDMASSTAAAQRRDLVWIASISPLPINRGDIGGLRVRLARSNRRHHGITHLAGAYLAGASGVAKDVASAQTIVDDLEHGVFDGFGFCFEAK